MVAPSRGQLSCGSFENVAPMCSCWNSWYVCCYNNGFLLVDDVDIWSIHSHWGLMFQPLSVIPNIMELAWFYLKLKMKFTAGVSISSCVRAREELCPSRSQAWAPDHPLPLYLSFICCKNGHNDNAYFLGIWEEDSWVDLCSIICGKYSSINDIAVAIFIIIIKLK